MKGLLFSRHFITNWRCTTSKSKMSLSKMNEKSLDKPIRISVEGNIGSGKSTFLNYFQQFPFIETYSEPLEKWRNVQGHNLLELLYSDMNLWNSTFQSYVQLTRTQIQTSSPKKGTKVQIFERSVQNSRFCFMESAYKSGLILPAQYLVLCKWYEWIQENVDISLDLIGNTLLSHFPMNCDQPLYLNDILFNSVYLKTNPEVVHERIINRNRAEEKISLEYLHSIHKAHEEWLNDPNIKIPIFVVDANKAFNDVINVCQKQLPILFNE